MTVIKKYLVFIIAIVILLGTFAAVNAIDMQDMDAASQLKLGEKYLSELQYEEALIAFNKVLEIEPKNIDAKLGIADTLMQIDKVDEAISFLAEELEKYDDAQLYTKLAEIYENSGEYERAISLLNQAIAKTDDEEIKKTQKELLNKNLSLNNTISLGNEHIAVINEEKVFAKGSNKFGQLGMSNETYSKLTDVKFSGKPLKVFSGDYTTYIVDDENKLWTTGINLTGQGGLNYIGLPYEKEFVKVDSIDNVMMISSGSNHTLLLKNDNTLWGAGNNTYKQLGFGNLDSLDGFTQIKTFNDVMCIDSADNYSLILKLDGSLWGMGVLPIDLDLSFNNVGLISKNIINVDSNKDTIAAVDYDGLIHVYGKYNHIFPTEYDDYGRSQRLQFDKKIKNVSLCDFGAIVIDYDNEIYVFSNRINGYYEKLNIDGNIVSMDGRDSKILLKTEEGNSYMIEFNTQNSSKYEVSELN